MMALLLAFVGVAKADVVTIGDGTSTTYVTPFNSLWGYSFVEQVYTADEIGTAGDITSISFNMYSSDNQTNDFVIYMKNVSRDGFTSTTDYETVTASDIVFNGSWTMTPGWSTITLDTPFAYDGTSNLMIALDENTCGYSTRYFYYTTAANSGIAFYSDTYNPDPYALSSYSGSTTLREYRANIIMDVALSNARVENDQCINSLPFCTTDVIEFEAASTSSTAQEEGMDDGCIGSSYNPSFYHMRIHDAGPFVIHMEGHDPNNGTTRDIDFCMWGPYTEQEVMSGYACTHLTGDKIMDCCYSASATSPSTSMLLAPALTTTR